MLGLRRRRRGLHHDGLGIAGLHLDGSRLWARLGRCLWRRWRLVKLGRIGPVLGGLLSGWSRGCG